MTRKIDLTGQRFGSIAVIGEDTCGQGKDKEKRVRWICQCDCGKVWSVRGSNLRQGNTRSCGCLNNKQKLKHGLINTPEYYTWKSMIQRCTNPKARAYNHYGGRGITVCDSWMVFENFYKDMGVRPSEQHTLDRIDNSKGYEPGNCRWATRLQQSRNTRNCVYIYFDGKRMSLSEAIEASGLKESTVRARRALGWPDHSLFLPLGSKRPPL